MIKYIEDLCQSIEYHFSRAFWRHKQFEEGEVVDKTVEYFLQHHVKYNVGKIQNTDMKTCYVIFSYVKPEDGEIQTHVVWCEDENNH